MPHTPYILYAILGGVLPALLWLWFFLREDRRHPEPKWLILVSFLAGMLAVVLVIPLERATLAAAAVGTTPIFLWAAIEELVKYAVAVTFILWRKEVDEPIDAMVYLITVALGFAALETVLFLSAPFESGDILGGVLTGNLRFLGAALIHTLSSAVIGFSIALTFFRSSLVQFLSLCTALLLASTLHALFNFYIIDSEGERIAFVFFAVWLGVVGLLLLFERAKRMS